MNKLENLKNFNEYLELNEGLTDGAQNICNKAFINGGPITFKDGRSVSPKEIVDVVNRALDKLRSEYTRTFQFGDRLNIILLAHSSHYDTMAVDEYMNLYMNAGFIYNTLKMDPELVAAVIMHEVLHVLFDHIQRGKNWLAAKGKPINNSTWNDNNLTADVEVNQTLVKLGLIDEERLINEIHGIFLYNANRRRGSKTNVIPMEVLLDDDEYMKKLRSMHPATPDPETKPNETVQTTKVWDKGYKDAWNKIAGLINKYGYKKVWEKLIEADIINSVGELNTEKDISDIQALEFINVKSFEEYLNESLTSENDNTTYEGGFSKGLSKILGRLQSAIDFEKEGPDSPEGPEGPEGPQQGKTNYKTEIKKDDLEKIDIPQKKGSKGQGGGDDLPENIDQKSDNGDGEGESQDGNGDDNSQNNSDNKESNNSNDSKSNKKSQGGKGGQGKSDDQISDDDLNKLIDDVKNKSGNEEKSKKEDGDPGAIGGTGSFINNDDKQIDDILKDAGYNKEDIEAVKKIRERNKTKNTKAAIQKSRDEMKRKLKNTAIGRLFDDIDIEAEKYKNVWKEIMEEFMAKNTRLAGRDTPTGMNDWKKKKSIARGEYGIHHRFERQDPQDVNVYVDVSGSMDTELLEIIGKSLVLFSQQYEYSGINVCPWASDSNGVYPVEEFADRNADEVTADILQIISKGSAQCGGGTEAKAMMSAMCDCIVHNLEDEDKEAKDDVHVVITDGYFDYKNIENRIAGILRTELERDDVADTAVEHTFWMIYDAPEGHQDEWKNEIKRGKLIFINSETVKNNK